MLPEQQYKKAAQVASERVIELSFQVHKEGLVFS